MEQRFVQVPFLLGLGHLAARSSYGATLRTSTSPTGSRAPCSLLLMEQRFAQVPLPLRLGQLTICSSHEATLRTSASPTGTRAPCSSLLPYWNYVYHKKQGSLPT
ncbi:hypothetical protein Adt_02014 [Abeliophyllum distichum]|uniref:Secreted protein n=1 Tax=Abeliophyllum distichum TaxID=126358 RepID=A0ABD1VUH0_9LAMI